jgi:hypothetical protein
MNDQQFLYFFLEGLMRALSLICIHRSLKVNSDNHYENPNHNDVESIANRIRKRKFFIKKHSTTKMGKKVVEIRSNL